MTSIPAEKLVFVTAVSRLEVLRERLCASPCIASGRYPLIAHFNARSAAQAFNGAIESLRTATGTWLVWVHQDVFLPAGWDELFLGRLRQAQEAFDALSVAGVYGLDGETRAGHVLDRGTLLREASPLPRRADSLDELLFAVRADARLRLDPALAFDFYATDLVLQAQAAGQQAAIVDAYCEHWSDTPSGSDIAAGLAERILASGRAFEAKWRSRMPIHTSWLTIRGPGDVERFVSHPRGA
ncbi:MAG TPA: hypothetical protein VHA82_21535 [Ramlibacter sp.]|uniref:hypothetical protein n=1 Tax=Ramlibacter sp. TaxID=1917967 RepID=UPI002B687364|nr:hypothetical protein [Ramlibacter sp.]HVZ46403.1 hypothetical protein [Ramlibacter sp.]